MYDKQWKVVSPLLLFFYTAENYSSSFKFKFPAFGEIAGTSKLEI